MTLHKKTISVIIIGATMISTNAYSGGSTNSDADRLVNTCYVCNQIPAPVISCPVVEVEQRFCGTENWVHFGNPDCKKFWMITLYCATGGVQNYTAECWKGAGSWCLPGDNPDCQMQ